MTAVKPGYFLLKYTTLLLLILSVGYLLNPEVANAGKASKLTSELKQLEKELETTSKEISTALKNNNEKELANLDSRIYDLNSKVDELRSSIDRLPGGGERQKLSDNAKNLWQDVQNLREDMQEGNVSKEDYKVDRGDKYRELGVELANFENLGGFYTGSDQPCGCDLAGLARILARLADRKGEAKKHLDQLSEKLQKQWAELTEDIGKKAAAMGPAGLNTTANTLNILSALAFDAADVALQIGSEKFSELGGLGTAAKKILPKIAGKTNAIKGGIEKLAGSAEAERMKREFPVLGEIDNTYDEMFGWAELASKYDRLENKLWDKMLKNADCLRKIGKRITGKACDLKGISEEELGKTDSFNLAGLAQIRTGEIATKGRIAWQECKLCEAFEALKQLNDLRNIADNNIRELNKGILGNLKTIVKLNSDLIKALSREDPKAGGGLAYNILSVGLSFAPWGGTAVAIGEGIADTYTRYQLKDIKEGVTKNLLNNVNEQQRNIKRYTDPLKKWKDVLKEADEKRKSIFAGLKNCDLTFDCGDKDKGGKTVPDVAGKSVQPDSQWKVNIDESTWCSYWIWETPVVTKGPGKGPSGGQFSPERPGKGKPQQPTGFSPEKPKKPGDKKVGAPGKDPVNEKDPSLFKIPPAPPPPPPQEKTNGPTIIYYSETDEKDKQPVDEPKEKLPETPIGPPEFIVKAKRDVLQGGKVKVEPVASAQCKITLFAPDLPDDGKKTKEMEARGSGKDPITGVLNKEGKLTLKPQQSTSSSDNRMYQKTTPLSGLAALWEGINFGITPVYAAPTNPHNNRKPVIVEVNMPRFESWILKIKIDRRKKNWDDPATYLGSILGDFVSRKWIVEKDNCMYAVVNTPVTKEGQK